MYAKGGGGKVGFPYNQPAPNLKAGKTYRLPGSVQRELAPFFWRFGLDLGAIRVKVMALTGRESTAEGTHLDGNLIALNPQFLSNPETLYGDLLGELADRQEQTLVSAVESFEQCAQLGS
jgi:hypothetical protein